MINDGVAAGNGASPTRGVTRSILVVGAGTPGRDSRPSTNASARRDAAAAATTPIKTPLLTLTSATPSLYFGGAAAACGFVSTGFSFAAYTAACAGFFQSV